MPLIRKWGNGLGIRVPESVAAKLNLREGTAVEFDTAGGVLTIRPKHRRRYTLAGLLAKAKGCSPHGEVGGGAVGREIC